MSELADARRAREAFRLDGERQLDRALPARRDAPAPPRTRTSSTRRAAATASRRAITSEARFVNAGG